MIKVLELFGGIGACSKALTNLSIEHEIVDLVEIDKYAVKSFNAVHGTDFEPQDITKWDKDIDVDLIMHGSPCQDFSVAGKQAGGDKDSGTRSSLMYETLRIVEKLKPKYVIWENVKNLLSKKHRHNFDAYLEAMEKLGYKNYYQVLNAKDYGVPQNRERVFTVSILQERIIYDDYNSSIRKDQDTIGTLTTNCGAQAPRNGWKIIEEKVEYKFPEPIPLEKKLKDVLEKEVDEKYYISDAMIDYFMGVNQKPSKFPRKERFLANINRKNQDIGNSVTTNAGQRPTDNFVVDDMYKNREPRVYNETSPTLRSERTGLKVVEPFIVASRGRGEKNEQQLEPRKDGNTNTITTVQKDNYVVVGDNKKPIKETPSIIQKQGDRGTNNYSVNSETSYTIPANPMSDRGQMVVEKNLKIQLCDRLVKDGVVQGGEIINHSYTTSKQRNTLDKYIETKNGVMPTMTTRPDILGYVENNPIRIRKLTPKECWRLMGFDDVSFERAEKVNSNAQLYKQAGNSIVVDVLMAIFRNLLDGQNS